jgi:hypothetical protein
MRFSAVFYDSTGRITSVQKNATSNVVGTRSYIQSELNGNPDDFYVADGQIRPKGNKPSEAHWFNYSSASWTLDLDTAKNQAWERIKEDRETEEFSTFVWNNHSFDCNSVSQMRIQSAVQAAIMDDGLNIVWTLADNTMQTFTASELKQIGQALGSHVSQCHERGRILRNQIDAATTEEDLEAIVW